MRNNNNKGSLSNVSKHELVYGESNARDAPGVCLSLVLLYTIFIIVVMQKLVLQQSKSVTAKCTETLFNSPWREVTLIIVQELGKYSFDLHRGYIRIPFPSQIWHETEFKEFEPRIQFNPRNKFKPRLKYGWFNLKLYQMFPRLKPALYLNRVLADLSRGSNSLNSASVNHSSLSFPGCFVGKTGLRDHWYWNRVR